jgi:adenosylmethionine-8-amino-7-oxononanoate aminotransferase
VGDGRVFRRSLAADPPVAVRAAGARIQDAAGREYVDAAGGAIVVGIGHGRTSVARIMAEQAERLAYVHGSAFTTEPLEAYVRAIGPHLPLADPALYPVSGGSEAIETALKMVRAYHLARDEPDRLIVVARWGSYHGNTLGALDLSGRQPLRRPYEGWLGRFRHASAAYPYRSGEPEAHALGTTEALAAELEAMFARAEPGTIAAFVAEPIVGATLGVVEPPSGYWPAIVEVCRRHGALVVADEVMTGFGRTGRWFASEAVGLRPDILVAAKGASSGYVPFGFAASSGAVHATILEGGFTHGFTFSHHPLGAAVAGEVLRILEAERLVEASERLGAMLLAALAARFASHPHVGEVRGRGLFAALELVADRESRASFPRAARLAEGVAAAARERGLLVYPASGHANGTDGDLILLGPPFVITEAELGLIVERLAAALEDALPAALAALEPARLTPSRTRSAPG